MTVILSQDQKPDKPTPPQPEPDPPGRPTRYNEGDAAIKRKGETPEKPAEKPKKEN
jgi:hypothetical protein